MKNREGMNKMNKNNITSLSVVELFAALSSGKISAQDTAKAYFEVIENTEKNTDAYRCLLKENAFSDAKKADGMIKAEKSYSLTGIPMGTNDNICTKDGLTSCGSFMLKNFSSPYDAFVLSKLKDKGAVMLGKLKTDEFAAGQCEYPIYDPPKNPVNKSIPAGCGSSGGAVSVAANEAAYAIASDAGGTARIPAAFCNVVGLKPTYGSVSRNGLAAYASSMEQISPITRTVADAALVYSSICGYDKYDSTSHNREYGDFSKTPYDGVKGVKIALPKEIFTDDLSPEIKDKFLMTAAHFEKLGASVTEVSIPSFNYALEAFLVISSAEAASNMARYDGTKYKLDGFEYDGEDVDTIYRMSRGEGFGEGIKRHILLGEFFVCSDNYDDYYGKAAKVRTLLIEEYQRIFSKFDIILTPTTPFLTAENENTADFIHQYRIKRYTAPASLAGLPALSMPFNAEFSEPSSGIQLIGNAFGESTLFSAGCAYENAPVVSNDKTEKSIGNTGGVNRDKTCKKAGDN